MYNDYELVYLAKEKDDDALKILINKYDSLLISKTKKYLPYINKYGLDYEDVFQETLIIFYNSILTFNQNNNSCFNTFTNLCIERKLSSLLTKIQKKLFYKEIISIESNDTNLIDLYINNSNTPENIISNKEDFYTLYNKIKNNLSNYENIIFELKINDLSTEEISNLLDKKSKEIYNVLDRIKIKTKRIISNNYHIN